VRGRDTATGWAMAAPAVAGLTLFIALPFCLAVALSLTDLTLGSPLPLRFAGFEQYRRIFSDPAFLRALANNALFAAIVVPVQTALALGLALLVDRELRGIALFRALFFLPVVFPLSLVSVVWVLIFAPGPDGMLNALLGVLTLGAWEPVDFLRHPLWALPAIMATSVWQGVGLQMVVLLAGLQGVDRTLYDAAAVDGAGPWRRFLHVTLPQLRNPLAFVVVVTSILSFRVFDQVRIMTRGGPGDASTTVVYEAVRAAFDRGQVARGAAMAVVFFVLVLALTAAQRRLVRQRGELP